MADRPGRVVTADSGLLQRGAMKDLLRGESPLVYSNGHLHRVEPGSKCVSYSLLQNSQHRQKTLLEFVEAIRALDSVGMLDGVVFHFGNGLPFSKGTKSLEDFIKLACSRFSQG